MIGIAVTVLVVGGMDVGGALSTQSAPSERTMGENNRPSCVDWPHHHSTISNQRHRCQAPLGVLMDM